MIRALVLAGLVVLFSSPCEAGIATPSMITGSTCHQAAGSTSLDCTTTADCPVGSFVMVAELQTPSTGSISAPTDSAGNTYKNGSGGVNSGNSREAVGVSKGPLTADLPSGGSISFHTSSGAVAQYMAAACISPPHGLLFSGIAINDVNVNNSASGGGTLPSVSSSALAQSVEIVVGMTGIAGGAGDTYTEASGFSSLTGVLSTDALRWGYEITMSNGAVTYAPTLGTSRQWLSVVYGLRGYINSAGAAGGGL